MTRPAPITTARIVRFWLPMAGTWLMMSVEAPFLAAVIARLAEPKENLAAFGVSFAVAILVEAPVIMMLSASTALVEGPRSFRRLRRFTQILNAAITALMLIALLTPLWRHVAGEWIGLPADVVRLTQGALLILLPWPGAIGYRRFYQGILIRGGETRRVAYGTVVRLAGMSGTALALFAWSELPGAWIGAAALSAGVCLEAVAARLMAIDCRRRVLATGDDEGELGYGKIVAFYLPLALTSIISLAIHPVVSFFMGHARQPLESLAVLPVVNSLSFIFRAAGLSYQEVAIAILGKGDENYPRVVGFAAWLGLGASALMALLVYTPLGDLWFGGVSGLSDELTRLARGPARILAFLPALSVLLSLQRAILVHARKTTPLTWATLVEVLGIFVALWLLTRYVDVFGATAAAFSYIIGRVFGNLWLTPPCRGVRSNR